MTLQDLITAVEGADGRLDDETLGRMICTVEGVSFANARIGTGDDGSDELIVRGTQGDRWVWHGYRHLAPDVSIDAAVALIERKLPGFYFELSGPRRYLNIPSPVPNYWRADVLGGGSDCIGWGSRAPLALCAALLRALQSQAQENRKDVS